MKVTALKTCNVAHWIERHGVLEKEEADLVAGGTYHLSPALAYVATEQRVARANGDSE